MTASRNAAPAVIHLPLDPENPTCTYCDPTTWPADINSAALFKEYYPLGYSYADDDAASTFCTRSNVSPWGTGNVLSDYDVVIYGPSAGEMSGRKKGWSWTSRTAGTSSPRRSSWTHRTGPFLTYFSPKSRTISR